MANEISFSVRLSVSNPSAGSVPAGTLPATDSLTQQLSLTQNAPGESAGVMSVPTTAGGTVLPVGSVTTSGFVTLTNLDANNYVQYGPTSAGAIVVCGKLKPGETAVFRLDPSATLRLLANAAAVNVQFKLFQD